MKLFPKTKTFYADGRVKTRACFNLVWTTRALATADDLSDYMTKMMYQASDSMTTGEFYAHSAGSRSRWSVYGRGRG